MAKGVNVQIYFREEKNLEKWLHLPQLYPDSGLHNTFQGDHISFLTNLPVFDLLHNQSQLVMNILAVGDRIPSLKGHIISHSKEFGK